MRVDLDDDAQRTRFVLLWAKRGVLKIKVSSATDLAKLLSSILSQRVCSTSTRKKELPKRDQVEKREEKQSEDYGYLERVLARLQISRNDSSKKDVSEVLDKLSVPETRKKLVTAEEEWRKYCRSLTKKPLKEKWWEEEEASDDDGEFFDAMSHVSDQDVAKEEQETLDSISDLLDHCTLDEDMEYVVCWNE